MDFLCFVHTLIFCNLTSYLRLRDGRFTYTCSAITDLVALLPHFSLTINRTTKQTKQICFVAVNFSYKIKW